MSEPKKCKECGGRGEWGYEGNQFSCSECHGTGKEAEPQAGGLEHILICICENYGRAVDLNKSEKFIDEGRQAILDFIRAKGEGLPEYAECAVAGHTSENCAKCAKAIYHRKGIDDLIKSLEE